MRIQDLCEGASEILRHRAAESQRRGKSGPQNWRWAGVWFGASLRHGNIPLLSLVDYI